MLAMRRESDQLYTGSSTSSSSTSNYNHQLLIPSHGTSSSSTSASTNNNNQSANSTATSNSALSLNNNNLNNGNSNNQLLGASSVNPVSVANSAAASAVINPSASESGASSGTPYHHHLHHHHYHQGQHQQHHHHHHHLGPSAFNGGSSGGAGYGGGSYGSGYGSGTSNRTNPNASLDEYVDILQVQQLLLENSSNSTPPVGPPAPSAPAPPSLTSTNGCSISSSTTTTLSTAIGGTSSTASTAKNRPKVNVQKASEYSTAANQLQGESPSKRLLFDYPSPYLYVTEQVELGANWIHGVLGNPMFELAMQHGLISIINIPKPHKVVAATEDGRQVPFQTLQEIYEAYVCFLRRCEEYFLCQYLPPPDIHSVGEHINLEAELYLNNVDDQKEKHLKKLIFECLLKRETCITGCHNMDEIDLLELGSYTELQGGNIVLPTGYSSILKPLCDTLPRENIVLSCPVKTIHWKRKAGRAHSGNNNSDTILEEDEEELDSDDSDKTVTEVPIGGKPASSATASTSDTNENSFKHYTSNVQLECDDGTVYEADHVICTLPLGVLKEHGRTMFVPSLPVYKMESIDALLYGTVDKIFLEYDRPFLNAKISEIMFLWEQVEPEPDADQDEYLKANWFKKIYSFSKVSDTLLLGWISGREAEYMETISHEVVAEKCTEILRKFLKDPFIPKPKRCVCTSWHKQPYSCGSYTAIAVGASQDDIENIAQPMYSSPHQSKPSVLFAGEHTHSNFYSTVHGAYLSGRTAAQILLTPDSPQEIVMESDSSDLSSWIQGIALE